MVDRSNSYIIFNQFSGDFFRVGEINHINNFIIQPLPE